MPAWQTGEPEADIASMGVVGDGVGEHPFWATTN